MEKKILVIDDGSEEANKVVESLGRRKIGASPFIPLMMGMMGVAAGYQGGWPQGREPFFPSKPKRIMACLQCGKEHKHNNAFCSADCCKDYKKAYNLKKKERV